MTTLLDPPPPAPRRRVATGPAVRRVLADPTARLGLLVAAVLTVLVVVPVVGLVASTLRPDGLVAWSDVLTGRLAPSLFWEPLGNSLLVGVITAVGSVLLGGGLAWLVVMTDVPGRRTIGVLATVPFALPYLDS